MLVELTHVDNARRYVAPLLIIGAILAVIGLGLIVAVYAQPDTYRLHSLIVPPALAYPGAAFLIAAAGFLSASIVGFVRGRLLYGDRLPVVEVENPRGRRAWQLPGRLIEAVIAAARALSEPQTTPLAVWAAVLVVLLFSDLAIIGIIVGWFAPAQRVADPIFREVLGGILIVAAFPLLVLERSYADISAEMLPDAPQLDRLLRVPLTACLGVGISMVLVALGFDWAIWIEHATVLLIAVVALELVLRSLVMFFVPFPPIERLRTVADSSLAGLLRLSAPNVHAFNAAVRQQFGIDLSRSWALAFVQRAMLPTALMMGLLAWAITGVTALGLNQRAVYEQFGLPVAVLGPGLHFHLPWPMGVMRGVELGVIHDIPIGLSPLGDAAQSSQPSVGVDQQQQLTGAEAPAPPSSDRLWDASHPSEQSYLIASEASGQQSFQVANADLRIIYRVGLSDAAAMDSAYRIADPETLIRASAGQLLVRYFSRYTLLDVLGQNREAFASEFRTALQDQLDGLSSGIDAIAVVVEAIHPPAGAASAYHNVQAAEILASSQIAVQRANAVRTMKSAEQAAMEDRNTAAAGAAELVDQAHGESILFDAAREANARDKEAFQIERRFESLVGGLSRSEFIVIDHRLNGKNAPTIDLRSFDSGGAARAEGRDVPFPPGPNYGSEEDADEFVAPGNHPYRSGSQP